MRISRPCTRAMAVVAPLVAYAAILPTSYSHLPLTSRSIADVPAAYTDFTRTVIETNAYIDLPGQEQDEHYRLDLDISSQLSSTTASSVAAVPSCGIPALVINGELVTEEWNSDLSRSHGSNLLVASSSLDDQHHALEVAFASSCQSDANSAPVQITVLELLSIDGTPTTSASRYSIVYDIPSRVILSVTPVLSEEQSVSKTPAFPEEGSTAEPSREEIQEKTKTLIENGVDNLRQLRSHLRKVEKAIQKQQAYLDQLEYKASEAAAALFDVRKCDSFHCFVSQAFNRAKECAKMSYLRLKNCGQSLDNKEPLSAIKETSSQTALLDGKTYYLIDDYSDASSIASEDTVKPDEQPIPAGNKGIRIVAAVGLAFASLCLGCFGFAAVKHCTDPRFRAEKAARREERKRAKEYRKLSRRKAWNDLVATFRCSIRPPTNDYEEKRQLILGQEAVLEQVMHAEIHRLRLNNDIEAGHGGAPSMRQGETLPAYHSRAGSIRPPSYTTDDDAASAKRKSQAPSTRPRTVSGSDVTPDSSIAAITPRQSSETLRSDRSLGST